MVLEILDGFYHCIGVLPNPSPFDIQRTQELPRLSIVCYQKLMRSTQAYDTNSAVDYIPSINDLLCGRAIIEFLFTDVNGFVDEAFIFVPN